MTVSVYRNNVFVQELPVKSGVVTLDEKASHYARAVITLSGKDIMPSKLDDLLYPRGSQLRITIDGNNMGRYVIQQANVTLVSGAFTITAWDLSKSISWNRWAEPYVIDNVPLDAVVRNVIQDRLPGENHVFTFPPDTDFSNNLVNTVWGLERDHDPWKYLKEVVEASGYVIYPEGGSWRMQRPTSAENAAIAHTIDSRVNLLSGEYTLDADVDYDLVVVTGTAPNGTPIVVKVGNTTSAAKPYFLTSGYITSAEQAEGAGQAQLARVRGSGRASNLSFIPDASVRPGRAVRLYDKRTDTETIEILSSVTHSITGMEASTATTRERKG